MTTLYKHQADVLAENPQRILLAHSTGTGKSLLAMELAKKNAKTVLVVVPKMLREKWERDLDAYRGVFVFKVLSKEEFKKWAKELPEFDCVIIDEAHYFAGMIPTIRGPKSSEMHRFMAAYMKKWDIKYRYLLTATPYLSTPLNIFALARLLGHEWDYKTFTDRFFWQINMGHRVVMKAKKGIEGEIADLVGAIGSIVDMEEIVVVPKQTHEVIRFELTEEQKVAKQEYAYTESTHIEQFTKEHQIENGFVYISEGEYEGIMNDKIYIINQIGDRHEKLAIFCRYKAQINMLRLWFLSKDREVFELHGDIKNRDEVIQQAEASDNCVILIQSACSAGYELPTFDTIIFASLDFSYVNYEQALGRFLRINKLKENRYIHLVSEGVDSDVYDAIMNKRDFSFEIYGKNK